jgi:hypothetical protein
MIHKNQYASRHPRRCNGTNGNGKEEEVPCGSQYTNVVPSKCQLGELYSLQQTLCCNKFLDHQQIREIWNV